MEEDQRRGWNVRKKVKCPIVQLYARKLKHHFNVWSKREEKIKEVGYRKTLEVGPTIHFCEPRKGIILGEEENEHSKKRHDESLMDYAENSNQNKDVLIEIWNEAKRSYVFNTNEFCMIVGCEGNEER